MRALPLTLALMFAMAPVARAQDPGMGALQQYRRQMVRMLEEMMFQQTGKTTSIIYARQFRIDDANRLYCGEALFGSTRQAFLLNSKTGEFIRAPSKAAQAEKGCFEENWFALIDLR